MLAYKTRQQEQIRAYVNKFATKGVTSYESIRRNEEIKFGKNKHKAMHCKMRSK